MQLKYLVTGTGRCGTVFMSRILTSSGIPCTHEGIFTPQGITEAVRRIEKNLYDTSQCSNHYEPNWYPKDTIPQAESSYMSGPYLDHPILTETIIVHVVRNPIDVIFSFTDDLYYFSHYKTDEYHEFIYSVLPELKSINNTIERATLYYVLWNEMIESHRKKKIFHKIENPIDELLGKLDIPRVDFNDTKANSKRSGKFTRNLSDIPPGSTRKRLEDMAERYGYHLPSNRLFN